MAINLVPPRFNFGQENIPKVEAFLLIKKVSLNTQTHTNVINFNFCIKHNSLYLI